MEKELLKQITDQEQLEDEAMQISREEIAKSIDELIMNK